MLGGPSQSNRSRRLTPRLGITDPALHTGLTPFLMGEQRPTSVIQGMNDMEFPTPNSLAQALGKVSDDGVNRQGSTSSENTTKDQRLSLQSTVTGKRHPRPSPDTISHADTLVRNVILTNNTTSTEFQPRSTTPKAEDSIPDTFSGHQILYTIADLDSLTSAHPLF